MHPELHVGGRIFFDTSRRTPTFGKLFVLCVGTTIVVKRFERIHDSEPPTIRLHSNSGLHTAYTCLASDVRFVGKVLCGPSAKRDRRQGFHPSTRHSSPSCLVSRSVLPLLLFVLWSLWARRKGGWARRWASPSCPLRDRSVS